MLAPQTRFERGKNSLFFPWGEGEKRVATSAGAHRSARATRAAGGQISVDGDAWWVTAALRRRGHCRELDPDRRPLRAQRPGNRFPACALLRALGGASTLGTSGFVAVSSADGARTGAVALGSGSSSSGSSGAVALASGSAPTGAAADVLVAAGMGSIGSAGALAVAAGVAAAAADVTECW